MRAFVLAAGEGQRMRPITLTTPKPLLEIAGRSLIHRHIERLRSAGITELVINARWLAEKLIDRLGDGRDLGVEIRWSVEEEKLETGGGIFKALDLLGSEPFLLINGDIWSDYPLKQLLGHDLGDNLGHLVLVDNPPHNRSGDFVLDAGKVGIKESSAADPALTFSGISLMHPDLVGQYDHACVSFPLLGPLQSAISQGRLTGEHYRGRWEDVGTPDRLAALNREFG